MFGQGIWGFCLLYSNGDSNFPVLCLSRISDGTNAVGVDESGWIRGFQGSVLLYWQFLPRFGRRSDSTTIGMDGKGRTLDTSVWWVRTRAYLNSRKLWCKDIKIFNYLHRVVCFRKLWKWSSPKRADTSCWTCQTSVSVAVSSDLRWSHKVVSLSIIEVLFYFGVINLLWVWSSTHKSNVTCSSSR